MRKSGYRFFARIPRQLKNLDHDAIQPKRIMVWCPDAEVRVIKLADFVPTPTL